jgi:hypothetical protein
MRIDVPLLASKTLAVARALDEEWCCAWLTIRFHNDFERATSCRRVARSLYTGVTTESLIRLDRPFGSSAQP